MRKLALPRLIDDHLRLGGVDGKGLLAEHMLAGAQAGERVLFVHGVGRGHIDGVDLGVGGQRLIAGVAVADAKLITETVGALLVA